MIEPLTDKSPMPFGKYGPHQEARILEDVPASYLLWLWDKEDGLWQDESSSKQPLRLYIKNSWSALIMDCRDFIPNHPPEK